MLALARSVLVVELMGRVRCLVCDVMSVEMVSAGDFELGCEDWLTRMLVCCPQEKERTGSLEMMKETQVREDSSKLMHTRRWRLYHDANNKK